MKSQEIHLRIFKILHTLSIFIIYFSLTFLSCCSNAAHGTSNAITILRLSENAIHISKDSGRTFESFNDGLPDKFIPLRITVDRNHTLYLSTYSSGLYKKTKTESKWQNITPPLSFERTIHSDSPKQFRKISAFAVHSDDTARLAVATKHALYLSFNSGAEWKEFSIPPLLRKHYITSLAFTNIADELLVGTSYGGMFVISGNSMKSFSSGLPFAKYSATLNFYDECGAIAISKTNRIHTGMSFSGALFFLEKPSNIWKKEAAVTPHAAIHDIADHSGSLYASVNGAVHEIAGTGDIRPVKELNDLIKKSTFDTTIGLLIIDNTALYPPLFIRIRHPFDARPMSRSRINAQGKKALYANSSAARKNIDGIIAAAKSCNLNTIVIDMKDDFGTIFFPTQNTIAKQIGAYRNPLDVKSILEKLHAKNLYAIARMVVFKDKYLYRAFSGAHAIADSATGASWMGNPGEFWLDPHSEFVHNYVIELARELEYLGFDEIQFDYIRFPSDGPIERCRFRHRKDNLSFKSEPILDFLRKARKSLSVPISVDVYGITGWYHFGNRIGQDMEAMAEYADVLCPMVYPSHFGTTFYRTKTMPEDLPALLVGESVARARMLAGENALVRPYLQAFNLLSPTWGPDYILKQIHAAEQKGANGFSFWNAKGDYDMVIRAMKK